MTELRNLLKHRLGSKVVGTMNRLTVRLDDVHHEKLKLLAAGMTLSKTAASEEILASAIDDAYAIYLEYLPEPEVFEVEKDLEDAINAAEYLREDDEERQAMGELTRDQELQISIEEHKRQQEVNLKFAQECQAQQVGPDPEEQALIKDEARRAKK